MMRTGVDKYKLAIFIFLSLCFHAVAKSQTNISVDPDEARILNSMFRKWGISANSKQWNISGELCSGAAIDSTRMDGNAAYNPGIKCDECSSTFCHITQLDLRQNYLTGPLSASIGNLVSMQYLALGINSLSGELPKELGNLTNLISLSIVFNNFSGPLPSELGSLTKLEKIYLDSSGVSGPIPSTYASLQNLATVRASGNELTGKIPEFIGTWSELKDLRLEGNSFEGPIPMTLSNLTLMTDLRISDLLNGSSTLEFTKGMKSLTVLILRNNNISGSIPSDISELLSLNQLDLSFNNFSGRIPNSLFNMSSLQFLFLGNNKLSGTLPLQKSAFLKNINLAVNNFTVEGSNSRFLPSGLNCLQRGFPCNRDSPRYYNFSIKCGGPPVMSSDGIVYERDNETHGPATYYVNPANRWAVSNVGLHAGNNNRTYTYSSSSQFTNTLDPELFQTTRISAGSLRYYGLGLENGNYTVKLQFAERAILNPPAWKSLGRRSFDIYIQGNLIWKNFDIRKEAGSSFRALSKDFKAHVSENYLEIHLVWAGKGTCCIPDQGTYGPSISAISATPDFIPSVSNEPPVNPSSKKKNTGLIVGIVIPLAISFLAAVLVVFFFIRRRKKQSAYEGEEFQGIDARPYTFSYAELKVGTADFSPTNMLGEGGFGPVYKGTLSDGRSVAVKQLLEASHHGKSQFVAEIATISAVQHRNLVKLYGCCIEGDKRLLVYEYLENKSLDQALFGKRTLFLNWSARYEICLGVARGLAYLHEESRVRIVHRDVKASNILLDSDLKPKISDFGLAKLYDDKKTHISTRVAGTIGYLAPDKNPFRFYSVINKWALTEKADVFGFGVVALEVVSGRSNSDSTFDDDYIYLLEWTAFNGDEVKRLIDVALLCTQTSPNLRPPMSRVVAMLSGDTELSVLSVWCDADGRCFIETCALLVICFSGYQYLKWMEMAALVAWGNCDALVTVFCGDGDMLLWLKRVACCLRFFVVAYFCVVLLGIVEIDRVMALRLGGRRRSFVDNRGNWIDLKCVHTLCHATVEWLYLLSTVERPFDMV
ncbi:putative LRR receptor-like serine/threonine-protein kinase [Heracleum sosnowskyi]|uniref:non-specific serine/threonine protein kinase n=1 Tax=Heracleum sosnowskyi TaxID=360622 RepID=A0AAD8HHE5_9APIA|nr:putative LRR receptor-like serine/threonine-protein kinase [Heracleum sosnowskyi]